MAIFFHMQHIPFEAADIVKYLTCLLAITGFVLYRLNSYEGKVSIRTLNNGISVIFSWKFFTKRHEFLWNHFKSTTSLHFSFKVLQHTVFAIRGEKARKAFFDDRSLDLVEGYKILQGSSPDLQDINVQHNIGSHDLVGWFNKQIVSIGNRTCLSDMIPILLWDIDRYASSWGREGTMDPFKEYHSIIFRLIIRLSTCQELVEDVDAINKIQELFWTIEKSCTPQALLLPWFPSRTRRVRESATRELFIKLCDIIERKRASTSQSSDPVDLLISQGHNTESIVSFILSVIHAGVINTGVNASWSIVYLGMHPDWKAKVQDEINHLLAKYTNSADPLHMRLAAIPISDWEDCMPAFDAVTRETIRLIMSGSALRRNLPGQMYMADATIEKGDFVIYPMADTHLNPEIYLNPHLFDPLRFNPERREDKKGTYSYLGWGAGRHPCSGIKIAKLLLKLTVAYTLAGYDYNMVDECGTSLQSVPVPNRNDTHQVRPVGEPAFLEFRKKDAQVLKLRTLGRVGFC